MGAPSIPFRARSLAGLLLGVLTAVPSAASPHGAHLSVLVAQYGDETYDRHRGIAYYDQITHLVRDASGKLNVAETSLNYAAALLVVGEQTERARDVIEAVLAQQDTVEGSPTRGLFRWMAEESATYDPRATTYLAPTLAHLARTVEEPGLQGRLQERARLALAGLLAADRPSDGFGAAMWAGAVCALAELTGDPAGQQAGAQAVAQILARLRSFGPGGLPAPTFDALRIGGLRWAWQCAPSEQARADAETALAVLYADMLQRYDPATAMVVGPIGSAYAADYLGQTGVARYLLACDLPSALAATRGAGPLAMYFALSQYQPPEDLLSLAERSRPATEVRSRTPAAQGDAPEAASTCTWMAPGMSLGTMSGTVEASAIPILVTCDLPERPGSYFYVLGGPATLHSAQSGSLALCSFDFDGIGVGTRVQAAVRGILGRRDQIRRVIVGRHEWIGEPEAVGQNAVVALQRGGSYLGVKILEVAFGAQLRSEVKPGVLAWFAEGNMDSLMLTVYGRSEDYPLREPLWDVRVGLLVEVAPASEFAGLEQFAEHVASRRVSQRVEQSRVRVDQNDQRQIPGRHEITAVGEMRFARFLTHTMTLVDEELALGLTEELLRNHLVSRTLPLELPADYLWASPALNLRVGGDPAAAITVPPGSGAEQ
ncbi:MAG: hypothetical protein AB7Y46_13545 [Armatimonadota bacterium]